ncbi:hypothetical protein BDV93DRAFT_508359 [Ceratobasidium sp. AG-I]|nr:hypothetical protein BDV93DRAFT_508359 [Ceratobasidium sp. AG-I]
MPARTPTGTYSVGRGSGAAYVPYIVTPLEGIQVKTESADRDDLTLRSDGEASISTVAARCNDTFVVIHPMENWIDNPNVTAVLFAYYPRQDTMNAIASVLYGGVTRSGKNLEGQRDGHHLRREKPHRLPLA